MPNRDMTGPRGAGPRTGRGLGPCEPEEKTDSEEQESEKDEE